MSPCNNLVMILAAMLSDAAGTLATFSARPLTFLLAQQQDPLGGWGFFVPLLLMLVLFWFLLLRPAQKREKERQQMLASIRKHDEVITAGGIIGRVVGIQEKEDGIAGGEDVLRIEVDTGTHLRVLRSMIVKVRHKEESTGEAKKS